MHKKAVYHKTVHYTSLLHMLNANVPDLLFVKYIEMS